MKKIAWIIALFILSGCGPVGGPALAPTATPAEVTPGAAPTPTATLAPALSPEELMYPYTIEGLRKHDFTRGAVKILSTIGKTEIFTAYKISYPSDGLRITGVMQVPAEGHPPFPVIVMDHGFFNRYEYKSGDGTDRAAEYLNKHGYLTVSSDYRSWGNSETGPSLYYSGLVIDVINLMNALPTIPQADATRVGIWGHSMGGAVTMKVLAVDSRPRAAVLYSTVSADDADVLQRWGLGCIGDIAAGEHQLGCNSSDVVPLDLPPELIKAYYEASMDRNVLQQTSPIFHLDLIAAPVQINFGTNDGKTSAGTPPEWSKKLYQAFEDADKPAELFAYDGEFHSFNGDNWLAFMERSARFYDQYVKGK